VSWIAHQWARRNALTVLLMPLSWLFTLIAEIRRRLFRGGVLRVTKLPRPTIIVGNISVGGTGKTPLLIWLCEHLRQHGYQPGIVSRGYRGDGVLRAVQPESDPRDVGDEPLLLARRCQVPVFVAPRRVAAGRALLSAHPHVDVILSDDGLQHYALYRDIELAVVDATQGLGNGLLLPAGPLREAPSRLRDVDAVVCHGARPSPAIDALGIAMHYMRLGGTQFINLSRPDHIVTSDAFRGRSVHAIAAIGHPQRFFAHLRALGLNPVCHAYADHHAYTDVDLAHTADDIVLMTEKDAVKCAAFAHPNWWYLPVSAEVDAALGELILTKLKSLHGSQAA